MNDKSVADERYYDHLETGPFKSTRADSELVLHLLNNQVRFNGKTVDIPQGESWDGPGPGAFSEHVKLSLRWLDPLRRDLSELEPKRAQVWVSVVLDWNKSDVARDKTSSAWKPSTLLQRVRTLALGISKFGGSDELLTVMNDNVSQLLKRIENHASTHVLTRYVEECLVLYELDLFPYDPTRVLRTLVENTVDVYGYVDGVNLSETFERRREIEHVLDRAESLGLDVSSCRLRLCKQEFLTHLQTPSGRFIEFGPGDDSADLMTGTVSENSPVATSAVLANSFVIGRSGWGETERRPEDESCFSVFWGERRKDAHEDLGRITFSSRGHDWLIDPASLGHQAKNHSTFSVNQNATADVRRMTLESVNDGDVVSDYIFKRSDNGKLKRRVIWSKPGESLMVDDQGSGLATTVSQTWIVNPEASPTPVDGGFEFALDEKTCRVQLVACIADGQLANSSQGVLEPLAVDGKRVAWRVTFDAKSSQVRFITFIGVWTNTSPTVDFDARLRNAVFNFESKGAEYRLVILPETVVPMPTSMPVKDAISTAIAQANHGGMSVGDAKRFRTEARQMIVQIKDEVWKAGGTPEPRRTAFDKIREFYTQNARGALVDHGVTAALCDLSWSDQLDLQTGSPAAMKRTPLINWTGKDYRHQYYNVPVISSRHGEWPNYFPDEDFIHSIDFGQLVLPLYVGEKFGNALFVSFHGATDRMTNSLPRFERLRSLRALEMGSVMAVSDPSLDLDGGMILSWYVGNENINMHREIAEAIKKHALRQDVDRIILVGNSGGGTAAIQVGTYLKNALAIAFNPQVVVNDYVPRLRDRAYWATCGVERAFDDCDVEQRFNVIKRLDKTRWSSSVHVVQNLGDKHHVDYHYNPLRKAAERFGATRIDFEEMDLGRGHLAPSASVAQELIARVTAYWLRRLAT